MSRFDTMENLISRLRFLETRACRELISEASRVEQRKNVTERFRALLRREEFFRAMDAKAKVNRDSLYD